MGSYRKDPSIPSKEKRKCGICGKVLSQNKYYCPNTCHTEATNRAFSYEEYSRESDTEGLEGLGDLLLDFLPKF